MGLEKKNLGKVGEQIASNYLQNQSYQIVWKNFRAKQYGEVDIIAQKGNKLVFVEVKTRISSEFGMPEEAISPVKLSELKKMVDYYFNLNPSPQFDPQIDVIAIMLSDSGAVKSLKHFENITL